MKIFASDYFDRLTDQARSTSRLRQHQNIHRSYDEPCQRFFNAIEPGSYIRPHRHASDPRDELLVAVRGLMALVTFSDNGEIASTIRLATERFGADTCNAAEVPSCVWHTVIALEPGSVLLEIKAGPFDPRQPKDLAPWAPQEGGADALQYLASMEEKLANFR
ncbi:WbuC family cupin fold metalloprotein [Ralstonia sp. VS2407]